jgi:predicted permease
MSVFLQQLSFSASITGPICLMLLLGVVLKRIKLIDEHFVDIASRLVFQVTLPLLLFFSILGAEHDYSRVAGLAGFGLAGNILFFLFVSLITHRCFQGSRDRGVVIQGSFRANTAIIGLAYIANAYGEHGVALAALYVAPMTILYNIQAVIALTPRNQGSGAKVIRVMLKSITRNPLIIAILTGLLFSLLSVPLPEVLLSAGGYFADMTLPLALLCTGGSLDLNSLRSEKGTTWFACGQKLVLAPLLLTTAAYWSGFRGTELGIVFFMSSAPTAAASYVMARSMGGNATLAANIIALTTVISLLTCTLGTLLLSTLSLL